MTAARRRWWTPSDLRLALAWTPCPALGACPGALLRPSPRGGSLGGRHASALDGITSAESARTVTIAAEVVVSPFSWWRAYEDFADDVRRWHRFVPNERMKRFLEEVDATSPRRSQTVQLGTKLYRAQVGCDWTLPPAAAGEGVPQIYVSGPEPFVAERMLPSAAYTKDGGRGNPPGIAYLYLSELGATAVAEVRPWANAYVSVARFKVRRDLRVLDLTMCPPAQD